MTAIDFHAHAFPDSLASRAVSGIEGLSGIKSVLNGTIRGLLDSMDAAGIAKSVVLSIATKPSQFDSIMSWAKSIASDRLVPFLSVHPADPAAAEKVRIAKEEGFKGLKFHPYYQGFTLDGEMMLPIYEAMERHGMICISHTGFDFAYPFERTADPPRIVRVLRRFPGLTFVATHLGAWKDWESAAEHLPGEGLYVDISYSLDFIPREQARKLILSFPPDRLLFGSDSPWADQAGTVGMLRNLGLTEELESGILYRNALRLLGDPI
jgi:predicted TIM-barrel fold metal-dependent hydrolase